MGEGKKYTGFVEVKGPNIKAYLVPEFYAPALNYILDGMQEKKKLKIEKAEGSSRNCECI
jgi:hypothetical protein